jgi:ParB family chromosome partitioning protein
MPKLRKNDARREGSTTLPERLVMQLTAQRTAALPNAVATRPNVAFVAVVHAMVSVTFYTGALVSYLDVGARSYHLTGFMPDIDESPEGQIMASRHAAFGASLPRETEKLWEALGAMSQEQLMEVLAYCAALSIDCVVRPGGKSPDALKHADALAEAVSLDTALT